MEDPADLKFSVRPDARPQRGSSRSSALHWWLLAVLGALVFLFVRGMLARGAETAGHSERTPLVTQVAPSTEMPTDEMFPADSTPMVYKCVGTGGAIAYQSFQCAADEATRGAYAARPDTWGDVEAARAKQLDAVRQARVMSQLAENGQTRSTFTSSANYDQARAQCEAAKVHRENTLRMVGLARTYDLLQRLDEMVREACKGT